ncbi:hypothetical protein [Corallococcus terminator]|uniref:hypothetical protein n=1 Tax=Corallococcus terminator TaxID=2316733 RepID=UPI00131592B3|nr:hypothetical protein [Corallococcus terminator]
MTKTKDETNPLKAWGCARVEAHVDLRAGTLDLKMSSGCEQVSPPPAPRGRWGSRKSGR